MMNRDYKTWLLLGAIYGLTSAGAVTTFFPMSVCSYKVDLTRAN
jgi:hypothetical protein